MKKTFIALLSFLFLWSISDLTAQKLVEFKISPCKSDCFILADIISQVIKNDTLNVELGVNLNCCGAYVGEIQYYRDTLNLISKTKQNKKGLVMTCDCNCYYNLNYKIINIKALPKVILFNNETIEMNRNYAGWMELENDNIDSLEISSITLGLVMYSKALKRNNKLEAINPTFKEDLNGMTSLDFSNYIRQLTLLSFSDSLVISETSKYSKCIERLSTIKYNDFLKLDSSDKYESLDCDLIKIQLLYRLQEKIENCRISDITISTDRAIVILKTFDNSDYKVIIEFQKINNHWKISGIK